MKILTKFIEVEFSGGTQIFNAIDEAKSLAISLGIGVEFKFNSVLIRISHDTGYLTREIVDLYSKELIKEREVNV